MEHWCEIGCRRKEEAKENIFQSWKDKLTTK